MAIEHKSRSQLACKVVDLRKLRPRTFIGRKEAPAAAEDVDNRVQLRRVRDWGEKQKQGNKLEDKLKVYYREVEILSSITHVSQSTARLDNANVLTAKHRRSRKGVHHRQYPVRDGSLSLYVLT